MNATQKARSTTVVAVLRNGRIALAADGQVTLGETVMKQGADKVRRVGKGRALVGFAGGGRCLDAPRAASRASSRRIRKRSPGRRRARSGLANGSGAPQARGDDPARGSRDASHGLREWGRDRAGRRGGGDRLGRVLCPRGGARVDAPHELDAEEIARASLEVAAEICVYTNDNLVIESLDAR